MTQSNSNEAAIKCIGGEAHRNCERAVKARISFFNPRTGEPTEQPDKFMCNQHAASWRRMERNGWGTCKTTEI